jgi:hypothetical protein
MIQPMGIDRDYRKEHESRKAKKRRLLADIEQTKAAAFLAALDKQGQTLTQWLNYMIDREIE